MAIFLMSLVAIGKLVTMGGERARDIEQQGEATMLAQSKLAEVVAGAVPLTSQSDQSFDEAPDYRWSLSCAQGDIANLWNVTVTVVRQRSDGGKVECVLAQLMLDPAQRGSSQDTVTISGSSGGGGGQSGSTGGNTSKSGSQTQPSAGQTATRPGTTPSAGAGKTGRPSTGTGAGTARPGTGAGAGTGKSGTTATPSGGNQPRTPAPGATKGGR